MAFHEGELAVQQRAGVADEAARLSVLLDPIELRAGATQFLRERNFAVITARDPAGRLWISPLAGPPGFLDGDGPVLRIAATPGSGDALQGLAADQPAGLLVIEPATRRRIRINGTLTRSDGEGLELAVVEGYGNCPKYIRPRALRVTEGGDAPAEAPPTAAPPTEPDDRGGLTRAELDLMRYADTFFLGTTHPERGADANHRGGPAGFARVEVKDGVIELSWPDFPGNNMFNSFGNLAVDDSAAVLFIDFDSGATLQLSGTAEVLWLDPPPAGMERPDGGTNRRVRFRAAEVTRGHASIRGSKVAPT